MAKTKIAWLVAIIGLLGYESYTLINSVPGDTLSEAVWSISHDYPLLPLLTGILLGHFFWQRKSSIVVVTGNDPKVAEGAKNVIVETVSVDKK